MITAYLKDLLAGFVIGDELSSIQLGELMDAGLIGIHGKGGAWALTEFGRSTLNHNRHVGEDMTQGPDTGRITDYWNIPPDTDDMVNNPPHYKQGNIECIDAIKAALTDEEYRGYCKGNAFKYIWRERHKGGAESLAKAGWYLDKVKA